MKPELIAESLEETTPKKKSHKGAWFIIRAVLFLYLFASLSNISFSNLAPFINNWGENLRLFYILVLIIWVAPPVASFLWTSMLEAESTARQKRKDRRDTLYAAIIGEYAPDEFFLSQYDESFVAIKNKTREFIVGSGSAKKVYSFDQIGKAEAIKNGNVVNTINRDSQAAGALVGGALFGGVGAIVGGLSASSTSKETFSKLTLRITVDDTEQPYWDVLFLRTRSENGLSPDQEPAASAIKKLDRFNALFFNILHRK